jgi:hypothetical protein
MVALSVSEVVEPFLGTSVHVRGNSVNRRSGEPRDTLSKEETSKIGAKSTHPGGPEGNRDLLKSDEWSVVGRYRWASRPSLRSVPYSLSAQCRSFSS